MWRRPCTTKILGRISDEIARRRREGCAGIIMMAGPSSSGKTTTGKRLSIQLMTNLIKPKMISLDDYFVDRVRTPLDENGEYDYESLYALDLDLFNSDLRRPPARRGDQPADLQFPSLAHAS